MIKFTTRKKRRLVRQSIEASSGSNIYTSRLRTLTVPATFLPFFYSYSSLEANNRTARHGTAGASRCIYARTMCVEAKNERQRRSGLLDRT